MNPKLLRIILLSLAFVGVVIGVYRSIQESDFMGNYWIFMVAFVFYLLYHYQKKRGSA